MAGTKAHTQGNAPKALKRLPIYFFENNKANDIKDVALRAANTANSVYSPFFAKSRRPQTPNFYIISAKIEAKDIKVQDKC